MPDAIQTAQENSLDYKQALNILKSSYWNYQNYKSGFLPKLSLQGFLPEYYRSINPIVQPNGQIVYAKQNIANSSLSLNLSQNIGLTGGNLSLGSSINRVDNFGQLANKNYNTIPISISYSQSNVFFNAFRQLKKIQPLRLKESEKGYLESLETISINTTEKYFDLIIAKSQYQLDMQNYLNADTLVKITNSRFEIGTANLNELLQTKISLLNAKTALNKSTLMLKSAEQNIIAYLNYDKNTKLEIEIPEDVTFFDVDLKFANEKASENRKYVIEFLRRKLEAEYVLQKTKSETGPSVSMKVNMGLNQTGANLGTAYQNLLNNQSLIIGLNIPLIDWGVNKTNRKRAEASLELEKTSIAQQQAIYEQEILTYILSWQMIKEKIEISVSTKKLSQQRYEIAKQKYMIGTLNFTDYNNAQIDKDMAVLGYINSIKDYWLNYYTLRRLTLFDFQHNKNIELKVSNTIY